MFVGYSVHHVNDVYRILNLDTKSIIQSRDIIWLNKPFFDWNEKKVSQKKEEDDDSDVISNLKIQEVNIVEDKLRSAQDQD
jgi:hypothetical protein